MNILDTISKSTCKMCKRRMYLWQRAEWSAVFGENIHATCGEKYNELTNRQRIELASGSEEPKQDRSQEAQKE